MISPEEFSIGYERADGIRELKDASVGSISKRKKKKEKVKRNTVIKFDK